MTDKKMLEIMQENYKEGVTDKLSSVITFAERRLEDMKRESEAFEKEGDVERIFRFMNELENLVRNADMSEMASKATKYQSVTNRLEVLAKENKEDK